MNVQQISPPANDINRAIRQGIDIAEKNSTVVSFEFNGAIIRVDAKSDPILAYRDYRRVIGGRIAGPVGPDYYPLTAEEEAQDIALSEQKEAERAARTARWRADMEAKERTLREKLAGITLRLRDPQRWQKYIDETQDPDALWLFEYASLWGRLMQAECTPDRTITAHAWEWSHDADIYSISGAQFSIAVRLLRECWEYGALLPSNM